jgi:hypothetical protein
MVSNQDKEALTEASQRRRTAVEEKGIASRSRTESEARIKSRGPFDWNYKPAEKHCWLFFERKILFRLKK